MSDSEEIIGARYRLLEHIGRGGMGTVWRARDEILGRDVAVKEVTPPDLSSPEHEVFTVRTLREARAAGRVGHPGVATVYDVIEEHGRPWIVMQLVESRALGAVVREDGPLPPARVARIGLEVLGALVAAHRAGVLHRDVKPDNVLLARDGRAVLTDFGIAVLDGDSSVTRTGALVGTPAFIAPERASGGPAEFASDLWSLGVTLYTAVEGRSPFERSHPLATLSAVMHEEPAPLRRAGPLGPVIYGLLRKDPSRRMTAQEAQAYLRAIASGIPPQATAPIELPTPAPTPAVPVAGRTAGHPAAPAARPVPGTPARAHRRRPAAAAVIAAMLAVTATAGGAAWLALTSAPPAPPGPAVSVPSGETPATKRARPPARKDAAPAGTRDRARNVAPAGPDRSEDGPDGSGGSGGSDRPPADERPGTSAGERRARDSGGTSEDGGHTGEDSGKGRGRGGGDGHTGGKIPGSGEETDTGEEQGSGEPGGEGGSDGKSGSDGEPSGPAVPGGGPADAIAGAPSGPERP